MVDKRALIETIKDFDALDNLRRSKDYIKEKITRKKKKPVVKLPDIEVTGQAPGTEWRKKHPRDGNQLATSKTTRHSQKYFPRTMKSTGRVERSTIPKVKKSVRSSGIPSFVEMVHEQNRIRRGR